MYFTGITIALVTFLTIGIWHPIVIKTEYYWGTRPWILYLLVGLCCLVAALFVGNVYLSSFLGVFGASALWGIGELFAQRKRVEKGWFPRNPERMQKQKQPPTRGTTGKAWLRRPQSPPCASNPGSEASRRQ